MENELSLHELTEVMDESFSANGFSKFPLKPFSIKVAYASVANTCPGVFCIPDFWYSF